MSVFVSLRVCVGESLSVYGFVGVCSSILLCISSYQSNQGTEKCTAKNIIAPVKT